MTGTAGWRYSLEGTANVAEHALIQAAIPCSNKRNMPKPFELSPPRTCRRGLRMQREESHRNPEQQALGSAPFFFLVRQSALDTAWVNDYAEVF